jgi:hypothetical protein
VHHARTIGVDYWRRKFQEQRWRPPSNPPQGSSKCFEDRPSPFFSSSDGWLTCVRIATAGACQGRKQRSSIARLRGSIQTRTLGVDNEPESVEEPANEDRARPALRAKHKTIVPRYLRTNRHFCRPGYPKVGFAATPYDVQRDRG